MSLFLQEWKKIWRPGILAIVLLLGAMYYQMFSRFYVEHFNNGSVSQASFDLAVEWVEKYGPTMEPSERAELDGQLAREIQRFNEQLASWPGAAELGLTDYETFQAEYIQSSSDQETQRLFSDIMNISNYYRAKKLENFIANYDWHAENPWDQRDDFDAMNPAQQARLLELEKGGRGFLPRGVVQSTLEYVQKLVVWIVLGVVLLLSPTLVRDRLHRMRATQWASRRGRQVLSVQFAVGACSAFVLTAVSIAIYAIPFVAQGPLALAQCPLFDWTFSVYPWFNGTYGDYLVALVLLLLGLGTATGMLTVFLSQYSGNYVAMLLKAIPLFVMLGPLLGSWLMTWPFWFRGLVNDVYSTIPRGAEAVCVVLLLAMGAVLLLAACLIQKKRELTA